jgi:hypothetical protein
MPQVLGCHTVALSRQLTLKVNTHSRSGQEQGMSNAGRGAALPDSEPTVDAITWAYVEAAGGDALAALRLAVADALYSLAEMDRRTRQVQRIRVGANAGQRGAL